MKSPFYVLTLLLPLLIFFSCSSPEKGSTKIIRIPQADKKPFEIVASHGAKRIDNYYWLRNREDSAVIHYLREENRYVTEMMAQTRSLQEKLFNEMKGRIKEKDESVPYKLDDYYYYTRYDEGYEYPLYCRKRGSLDASEEIIANGNELSKGQSFFDFDIEVSPDHTIANIIVDTVGRRLYTIMFKDMETGQMLPDKLPGTEGDVVWFNDNKTVLYSKQDPVTLIANKVYRHVLGTSPANDVLVYEETDPTLECSIEKTASERYILITSARTDAAYQRYIDANMPRATPVVIEPLQENVKYFADHLGDKFFIRTNYQAKNFRLVSAPVSSPGRASWKDVIPNRNEVFLDEIKLLKDYLVLEESSQGLNRLRVIRWRDKSEYFIEFDEPAYMAALGHNPEVDTDVIRYSYQSMTTPNTTYDYNLTSRESRMMKQQEILGGFSRDDYATERVMAKARDGKEVPISIVYRKDKFRKDGTNPCLQYAYGSYGASMYPYFNSKRLSLLDRGFVYAVAHIRGGQEMGGQWYEEGKMFHKMNTFTDYIDCSEFLIENQYTSSENLFAEGGSAGGLLMGAVANLRPDLYKGIIAWVPFVDVVTTMMDETIPLTTFEWKEWGNPNVEEEYEYMLSYSPYDNVEAKQYPNILVLTGFHDSQVQYWEPAKWVAKLREMKTDNNLLLFKTNMIAGHGGSYGRFERLKDDALAYAFMLDLCGITE
jgi:oligopeptidase B